MIKRLVWTIILLSPAVVAGFIAIIQGEDGAESALQLFNAGNALNYTWEIFVDDIPSLFGEEPLVWELIKDIILASLFITPFVFVWRGLFIIEWIPLVGHALRAITIAALIFVPGLLSIMAENGNVITFSDDFNKYFEVIVLGLALVGLWLPKSMTRSKK